MRLTNGTPGWGDTTVNLADHSKWVGGFHAGVYGGGLLVQGPGQFANTSSIVGNGRATIDADVAGTGTFDVTSYRGSGRLEFMRSVSSGQSITVETNTYYAGGRTYSTLQVDQPESFGASVSLGYGEVILNALKADSYTFRNDLLSLYDGGNVVDTVPLKASCRRVRGNGLRRHASRQWRGHTCRRYPSASFVGWRHAASSACLNLVPERETPLAPTHSTG